MKNNSKLFICKGIIQYLLESSSYTLENIADLTNTSVKKIRAIYQGEEAPEHSTEMKLLTIYQFILELTFKSKITKSDTDKFCHI